METEKHKMNEQELLSLNNLGSKHWRKLEEGGEFTTVNVPSPEEKFISNFQAFPDSTKRVTKISHNNTDRIFPPFILMTPKIEGLSSFTISPSIYVDKLGRRLYKSFSTDDRPYCILVAQVHDNNDRPTSFFTVPISIEAYSHIPPSEYIGYSLLLLITPPKRSL